MERNSLRFGIICDSKKIEEWQIECVKKLLELNDVKADLVILLNKIKTKQSSVMSLFKDSVRKLSRLTELVNGVRIYQSEPVESGNGEYSISKEDMKIISDLELDFLLNFSSMNFSGEMIHFPKYGVWFFQYSSDLLRYLGDINNQESITFARLLMMSQKDKQLPLKEGCFSTIKDSFKKNRELITSTISTWPALVCRDILNNAGDHLKDSIVARQYPNVVELSLTQIGKFIFKISKNKCQRIFSKLFSYEYWNIGIVHKPIHEFLNDQEAKIDWLVKKKDLYYADPFAYWDESGLRILMEEVDYRVVKGFISIASIERDIVTFDQALIKLPCHMSYPYLLEHNNQIFCIPETSEAREASIYRLDKQTKEWEKVKTLVEDFQAVDSTIVKYDDTWWLFCTKSYSTVQSHNNELHVFYSSDLFGKWNPHCLNPVKVDIRSARPAGTPFIYEGTLFRPAQDCSQTYGGRIALNRIKTLTVSQFEEETVSYIEPMKGSLYPDGVHTISSAGGITIIDGKRFDYNFLHLFRKLYKLKPINLPLNKSAHFVFKQDSKLKKKMEG